MCNILYTSRPNSGSISVSKVVVGMPDDTTYFHVILTGASSEIPIADGWIKTGQTIKFSGLPFDTYTLTEDAHMGYKQDGITPASIELSRSNRTGSIGILNTPVTPIKYGALYNWYAASKNGGSGVGSIAPSGWHVPNSTEWLTLIGVAGSDDGIHLCESGTFAWNAPNASDNSSEFTARGNGSRQYDTGKFDGLRNIFSFYTIDKYVFLCAPNDTGIVNGSYEGFETFGAGLRCIKNTSDYTPGETVTDYDVNVYPTIKIGNQVWMAANLAVTRYNDGTPIPNVTGNTAWAALTTGAMCYYNNEITNK